MEGILNAILTLMKKDKLTPLRNIKSIDIKDFGLCYTFVVYDDKGNSDRGIICKDQIQKLMDGEF